MFPYGLKLDHEYYIIEFNDVQIPDEVFEWLNENFGDTEGRWSYRHPRLYFANSKDHLLFTLKWS